MNGKEQAKKLIRIAKLILSQEKFVAYKINLEGGSPVVMVYDDQVEKLRGSAGSPKMLGKFLVRKSPTRTTIKTVDESGKPSMGKFVTYTEPKSGVLVFVPASFGTSPRLALDNVQLTRVKKNLRVPEKLEFESLIEENDDSTKVADGGTSSGGFTGRGVLTPYKGRKDSWILNQMEKGKVDPGIEMTKSKNKQIEFKTKAAKLILTLAKKLLD